MRMSVRYVSLLATGALIALVTIVVNQGSAPPAQALFNDTDGDSIIDVAESALGSDPNDAHSTPEEIFPDLILGTILCSDGVDNDGDGATDIADGGCTDSDDDIISDAMETLLGSNPNSSDSFPEDSRMDAVLQWLGFGFAQACIDAQDNDADGFIDAADSGCVGAMLHDSDAFDDLTEKLFGSDPSDSNSVPEHETANPDSCSDGIDNDRDGLTDGAEPGCELLTNDNADQATVVGALPFEDSVKVNSAGLEPGEPNGSCFFEPQLSIWYKYTATSDGVITADTAGSNFTTAIAVYTRAGPRYTEVSCAPAVPNRPLEAVGAHATIRVTAGETYYVQAIGYIFPGLPNKLRMRIDTGHPPVNDNYASPRVITSLPFSESVSTADASSEQYEPTGRCIGDDPDASVWYRYASSGDALLIADTRGSNYGTAISVWTDSQFGLAEVGCTYSDQRVAFPADAGRTYYVQVTSRIGSAGSLHFSLIEGQSPANDDFADAINASPLPFEHTTDTFTATNEAGEPVPSCSFGDLLNTVWYKVTPQQDGFLETFADNADESPYTIVGVYQGSSFGDLTELTCTQPFYYQGASEAGFAVSAGQTYYLQVGTLSYGGGKIPTVEEAGGPGGFGPTPNVITFHLETLVIPACAASEFTFNDPRNDQIGGFGPPPQEGPDEPPDVTSVSGGSDGENFCLRVQLDQPLPPPSDDPFDRYPFAVLDIDADENADTGYSRLRYECGADLGAEVSGQVALGRDILVPLEVFFPFPGGAGFPEEEEEPYGFATYAERSFQLIIPLDVLGGEDHLRFGLAVYGEGGLDCVPNGGVVVSPEPVEPGDVNCDGATNSLDSALILQRFAGLLFQPLPCEYVGDVNQNGGVGPIDAVLILQYNSGMLNSFSVSG